MWHDVGEWATAARVCLICLAKPAEELRYLFLALESGLSSASIALGHRHRSPQGVEFVACLEFIPIDPALANELVVLC